MSHIKVIFINKEEIKVKTMLCHSIAIMTNLIIIGWFNREWGWLGKNIILNMYI